MMKALPPKRALQFLRWFCREDFIEEIEGDLLEIFHQESEHAPRKANWKFGWRVLKYFRPEFIKSFSNSTQPNPYGMYKNFFKVGYRNLVNNVGYSLINIGGLALGIAVAMLIGLWINDEFSFNKHQENYNRVAAVLQHNVVDGSIQTGSSQSYQLGPELREQYGNYFKHVVMATFPTSSILALEDKAMNSTGTFMEPEGPELYALTMVHGTRASLNDQSAILLSSSVSKAFFGDKNPLGQVLKLDNGVDLKVTGVYQDIPDNSNFKGELGFIAHLDVIVNRGGRNFGWVNNWLQVFVEVADHADMQQASLAIKEAKLKNVREEDKRFNPQLFLHPLSKWRLYSGFVEGVNTGGQIEFVWLFGCIGVFVLLLACINFMNLSTARSQKRSKEVGVRKVVGSRHGQLVRQFFIESLMVVVVAVILSIILVFLFLPTFNEIANKNIHIHWTNPYQWMLLMGFVLFIALLAGSYPAFYLSSFSPLKVMKGTFKVGKGAVLPRKVLVVVQFTISIILIIGTIVVYQQIQFAKDRPLGYEMNGLVTIPIQTAEVKKNYRVFREGLLATGMFDEVSTSETTITNLWWSDWGFQWSGKDPDRQDHIYRGAVDYEFGKTIGWKVKEGRDFSREFASDSTAMILNEAAVNYMGFENPIGENIRAYGREYTVIGVVEDMVTQSLYDPNKQTVFVIDPFNRANFINIKINPQTGVQKAIAALNRLFTESNPGTPFEYTFADDEFANKFSFEARVGKLVGIFATLAIFISALGLFGLASFMAEQRTKEIGIRKVLGANVTAVWKMLSQEFIVLVVVACCIAIPMGYYLMDNWLQAYNYRTDIPAWILLVTGMGALAITLLTVSFQALKAAIANPVDAIKSE